MAAKEFEIIGADNIAKVFEQLPFRYGKKPVVAAFRKGAKPFVSVLRKNTPKQTGETRKSIKVKALRGAAITVGFSGAGSYLPGYIKAYWNNYGTLSNRDAGHRFTKARKSKSSSWQGGIKATGFMEKSWEETKNQVQDTIDTELETQTVKFLNKYRVE